MEIDKYAKNYKINCHVYIAFVWYSLLFIIKNKCIKINNCILHVIYLIKLAVLVCKVLF